MNEDGATFQSYVDGDVHLLSPETSSAMQKAIGSDIMMVLDQCIPSTAGREETAARPWSSPTAGRCARSRRAAIRRPALFGIVQGACHRRPPPEKRARRFLREPALRRPGHRRTGRRQKRPRSATRFTGVSWPRSTCRGISARYLMGVGTPLDILEAVHRGVDMFDCIIPTQLAQRGTAVFTSRGRLHLRRAAFKFCRRAAGSRLSLYPEACREHTRAYLHHLIKSDASCSGWHLLSIHNLTFYHRLMAAICARASCRMPSSPSTSACASNSRAVMTDEHPSVIPKPAKPLPTIRTARRLREIHPGPGGFNSVRQISSGEVMHSVNRPDDEANQLYVEQSFLAQGWALSPNVQPPTFKPASMSWSCGMSASGPRPMPWRCLRLLRRLPARSRARDAGGPVPDGHGLASPSPGRASSATSDPLRLASNKGRLLPACPSRRPEGHSWPTQPLDAQLGWHALGSSLHGDFLALMHQAPDPGYHFLPTRSRTKTDSALWTAETFARVLAACAPKCAELCTPIPPRPPRAWRC